MPNWIEIIVRTLVAVVVLFLATKLLGKRQITELSLFEYITGITIGNIAGYISLDLDNLWFMGLISIAVWISVSVSMEYLTMKSKKVRDFVDGKGRVLIKEGELQKQALKKERLTLDELLAQLRSKDVYRVADVEFAVMEASGEINVLLKKEFQPLTPDTLGWRMSEEKAPSSVIMDGKLLPEVMESEGLDLAWLEHELQRHKLKIEDVMIAQIDSDGQLSGNTLDGRTIPEKPNSKSRDRVKMLMEQFEAELIRLQRLSRNESDRRTYESALERFRSGTK